MNESFVKLFSGLVTSSIWSEAHATKIVWITMLSQADQHGEVCGSIPGLARIAGVTLQECEEALEVLSSPDRYSRTPDHDGRRIQAIEGGWAILNHGTYRKKASEEDRREKARERQARRRAKERDPEPEGAAPTSGDPAEATVTPCHASSRPVTPERDTCVTGRDMSRESRHAEAEADTEADQATAAATQQELTARARPRLPGSSGAAVAGSGSRWEDRTGAPGECCRAGPLSVSSVLRAAAEGGFLQGVAS